ncbi:MAG: M20/M25/M40 family metallo-hydrolase [Leptolyngbyaceae bacterium]|nr:M20/M25/M40 family metallo-hydrolase [Leptolyngbyaceae bacterium]
MSQTDDILSERLRSHVEQVAIERDIYLHRLNHLAVREYVREQLSAYGSVDSHRFSFQGESFENLILDIPGSLDKSADPILIGAHYDGVMNSPGADDNASGVSILLELARSFSQHLPPYPVRLVAFDLEELGLLGSQAYAAHLREQQELLRLMLSLEMLGYRDPTPGSQQYPSGLSAWYPNRGDFVALVGNVFSIQEMRRLSRALRQGDVPCEWLAAGLRGVVVPATRLSDHAPFWDVGYRAMMVTDTAFLRNPNYHMPSDRPETLDFEFMAKVCRGLESGVRSLLA